MIIDVDINVAEHLDEVNYDILLEELVSRDEFKEFISTGELIRELKDRDLDGDHVENLKAIIGDEINLDELDRSLFYMSQDDFSKLLKIVEYHKEHRNVCS
jgi:hypothetical protein